MKQLPVTVCYKVESGQLVICSKLDKVYIDHFVSNLTEGDIVEVTFQEKEAHASKAQLAKLYACVTELSKYLGYTREEIKNLVKEKVEIYNEDDPTKGYKSFSGYSKEELMQAIDAILQIGQEVGFPME